jgi:hypothetical protein
MYFNSVRFSVNCTISAVVATAIKFPSFRYFAIIICVIYLLIWAFSTFKIYSDYEIENNFGNKSLKYALIDNGKEMAFFVVALIVAVMVML